ncbi:hypothetical protein [Allosphingosinicella vermicomposti]|uniref:hypothetical protein n=1 Tax=Allosphingosinicella vermicomposti TaxID=614671 RepID=UPI000D0EC263|nr:hypothetical protein [Allosphingosinicella vermicomposti]
MPKLYRAIPAWLVALPLLAPTFAVPAMAESLKPGQTPFCPPPPTQRVATFTFSIDVTGTHKSEAKMYRADVQRSRTLKGVARMVYNGESDHDDLDANATDYGEITRTPDIPDGFEPGETPIVDGKRNLGNSAVGGLAQKMQTRIAECQRKGGPDLMQCQMEAVKAIGAEAERQCDPDDPESEDNPMCAAIFGGDDGQVAELPTRPGQCIPGKKGVESGPFENWISTDCRIDATIDDRGTVALDDGDPYNGVRLESSSYSEKGSERRNACQVLVSVGKMTNKASISIDWGGGTVATTESFGGDSGKALIVSSDHSVSRRITADGNVIDGHDVTRDAIVAPQNSGEGQNSSVQTKNGTSRRATHNPMDWSTMTPNWKKLFVGTPMGSRSNFQGSWTTSRDNPPGAAKGYWYGQKGSNTKTDSKTVISWHFDADPKPHVIK